MYSENIFIFNFTFMLKSVHAKTRSENHSLAYTSQKFFLKIFQEVYKKIMFDTKYSEMRCDEISSYD